MKHKPVVMYSTASCPFCLAARKLLQSKNVTWTEISLEVEPDKRTEMLARSGRRTVPQIFIDDTHVGGFDDLAALEQEDALDRLLAP